MNWNWIESWPGCKYDVKGRQRFVWMFSPILLNVWIMNSSSGEGKETKRPVSGLERGFCLPSVALVHSQSPVAWRLRSGLSVEQRGVQTPHASACSRTRRKTEHQWGERQFNLIFFFILKKNRSGSGRGVGRPSCGPWSGTMASYLLWGATIPSPRPTESPPPPPLRAARGPAAREARGTPPPWKPSWSVSGLTGARGTGLAARPHPCASKVLTPCTSSWTTSRARTWRGDWRAWVTYACGMSVCAGGRRSKPNTSSLITSACTLVKSPSPARSPTAARCSLAQRTSRSTRARTQVGLWGLRGFVVVIL